ncbi:MAG TPA: hypothetical protein VIJ00_13580 [Nakamurella sp.]
MSKPSKSVNPAAGGEVGDDAAEQSGPDHQLLQRSQIRDRRCTVGVGGGPRPDPGAGGAGRPRGVGEVGAEVRGQGVVERRVGESGGQQGGVDGGGDPRVVQEHLRTVGFGRIAGVDEPDHPAVGVDAVGQHITADGVLVGVLDVVRGVGEERDAGEPELGEQRLAGGVGAGEFLVVVVEVGFQRVDRFQPDRDPAGVDLRRPTRTPREGVHQGGGVRCELHRVPVGLRSLPR